MGQTPRLTHDEFAENFRRARRAAGITQKHLAAKLGVTADAVSRWSRGRAMPGTSHLARLAELLNISSDTLVTKAGPTPGLPPTAIPVVGRATAGNLVADEDTSGWPEVFRTRVLDMEIIIRRRLPPA